jgi:catechol 2,3-dioxygenase-like lactoylglutathione lyase family enzyme
VETAISKLVSGFEAGALTRRELIQGLAMLTAAGASASAQSQGEIKVLKIDHVSVQVSDLPRSIEFYQKMFGLKIVGENRPEKIVRLGMEMGKTLVSLHDKSPTGLVDHFAIAVENFTEERLTREFRARGASPQRDIDAGLHIKDPEGINVQVVGLR